MRYTTTLILNFDVDSVFFRSDMRQHDESASAEATWNEIFRHEAGPSSVKPLSSEAKLSRPQTITERESKVIADMLDMIFNKRRSDADDNDEPEPSGSGKKGEYAGVGGDGQIDDLVGRLRRHSRPLRWAKEPTADLLDEKKEQMLSCNSDQELIQWAQREVFDESRRYEEAARKAIEIASEEPTSTKKLPSLQSPVYPQVIAHLMRTFRDHYRDPNLALFIFHHTQKLSIVSYVFGCSTEVYNELIKTRWDCFRDLQGVYDAVEEMNVNGVPLDSVTRKLIEIVRHDVGNLEMRPDASVEARQTVWTVLNKIEHLVSTQPRKKADPKLWDKWKSDVLNEAIDDESDWAFDNWAPDKTELATRKRKTLNTRRALSRA